MPQSRAGEEAAAHRLLAVAVARLQVEAADRPVVAVAALRVAEADAVAPRVAARWAEILAEVLGALAVAGVRRASAITEGQAQASEEPEVALMEMVEGSTRADAMAVDSPTAITILKSTGNG
jgi:hypothetical protein